MDFQKKRSVSRRNIWQSGNFLGVRNQEAPWELQHVATEAGFPMGSLNSPKPCSDLLSFLANSGMETSKNVNVGPTAVRWSATSSRCFDITELFDFAWDGREIHWIGDLNDTSKIFSNIQNIFKFLTLQEISPQLSVLRAKIQPTYVGTQALVFFTIPLVRLVGGLYKSFKIPFSFHRRCTKKHPCSQIGLYCCTILSWVASPNCK